MIINVIATGSSGNLYELVDSIGNSIIIEAGMSRSDYMKNKVGTTPPEMMLISHGHMDHSKHKGEFAAMIPVYFAQTENLSENFKAFGFKLKHGDGFSTAFIIKSLVDGKFIFFGTDFEFSKNYDELYNSLIELKVDNFLIECNYNDFLLHLATKEQRRGCERHLSDNDVVNFMRIVKPISPKIILIHGSNRLSINGHTKKYIVEKLLKSEIIATIEVAIGAKQGVKNIFNI